MVTVPRQRVKRGKLCAVQGQIGGKGLPAPIPRESGGRAPGRPLEPRSNPRPRGMAAVRSERSGVFHTLAIGYRIRLIGLLKLRYIIHGRKPQRTQRGHTENTEG